MSEWVTKPLGKLAEFKKGKKVHTSDMALPGYKPYLGASSLTGGHDAYAHPNGAVPASTSDVLMLWDGENSGLVGKGKDGVISSTVMRLQSKGEITADFLRQYLQLNFEWIQNRRTGTGVPHVPKDLSRILNVKFPKEETAQQEISTVLTALDSQIEQTEALIAKQENIRQGLMQDLFTRGVNETGQLRPAYKDAPHFYHETELGWLPLGWEVKPISQLLELKSNAMRSGPFGSSLLKNELVETGIPFLGIDNIFTEFFKPEFSRYVTERKFLELSRYQVFPDDVIISIMGTVGRCCVVPYIKSKMLSSKHLWTISFNQNQILSNLVCWQLNYAPWVLAWFRRETQGGIMDAIQSSTLKNTKLVVPDEASQTVLNKIYIDERKRISSLKDQLAKSNLIKAGLMRDLLSGDVSVAPLMQDASA